MSDFLKDCFQKIGWEKDYVSFDDFFFFFKVMVYCFLFENCVVFVKENYNIIKEELWCCLVKEQYGGFCYDLNGLIYFVLCEVGFYVKFIWGMVYVGK